jgi:AcrR family transcriptional regulator
VQTLVLERGLRHSTVDAIAKESGAPVGSLYHRFRSRDRLMAELWIRAVRRSQTAFLRAAAHPDAEQAAVDAALSIYDFVRQHPADAKLLASYRRQDFLHDMRSARLVAALTALNRPLEESVRNFARRLYGRTTRTATERVVLAVVDLPMGAVRRYLLAGSEVPAWIRDRLEAAVRAVLGTRRETP